MSWLVAKNLTSFPLLHFDLSRSTALLIIGRPEMDQVATPQSNSCVCRGSCSSLSS
jgi:hypothetical protein